MNFKSVAEKEIKDTLLHKEAAIKKLQLSIVPLYRQLLCDHTNVVDAGGLMYAVFRCKDCGFEIVDD